MTGSIANHLSNLTEYLTAKNLIQPQGVRRPKGKWPSTEPPGLGRCMTRLYVALLVLGLSSAEEALPEMEHRDIHEET